MTGLRGFASHGGSVLSRGWMATVEAPGYLSQAPTIHLSEAVSKVLCKPNLIDGIFFVGIWHYDSVVLCSLKEKNTVKPQFNEHPFNKFLSFTPHILPCPSALRCAVVLTGLL